MNLFFVRDDMNPAALFEDAGDEAKLWRPAGYAGAFVRVIHTGSRQHAPMTMRRLSATVSFFIDPHSTLLPFPSM